MLKLLLQSVCCSVFMVCLAVPAFSFDDVTVASDNEIEAYKEKATPQANRYSGYVADAKEVEIAQKDTRYKQDLINAMSLHNLMVAINDQMGRVNTFRMVVLDKAVSEARIKDFDACNEGLLSDYFAKPDKVWAALKDAADKKMEDYNLNMAASAQQMVDGSAELLASADAVSAQLQKEQAKLTLNDEQTAEVQKMENEFGIDVTEAEGVKLSIPKVNDFTEDEDMTMAQAVDENAPEMEISYAVLNLFYPNQDVWGKRKSASTSSLPLWEDQKYLYNKDVWEAKYQDIRAHCEKQGKPLVMGEPQVTDKVKYDYYFYDDVQSAHKAFVAAAAAQQCVLTPQMTKPPVSAPRPLPPVYEQIVVFTSDTGHLQEIYPVNPQNPLPGDVVKFEKGTLWEAYKADAYQDIAKGGELDTYFKVSSSTIQPRQKVKEIDGNRLSKYLMYKADATNALEMYESYLDAENELRLSLAQVAETISVDLPQDINYWDKADLQKVFKLLKTQKDDLLKKVELAMGQKIASIANMSAEQLQKQEDLAYYNGLKVDENAEVLMTLDEALIIDEAIKKTRANKKLVSLMNEASNQNKLDEIQGSNTVKGKNFKADRKNCIGQSNVRLLNIDTVQIK